MREKLPLLFLIFYFILPLIFLLVVKNPKIKKTCALIGLAVFIPVLIIGVFGDTLSVVYGQSFFKTSGLWCDKTFDCTFSIKDTTDFMINAVMLFPIGIVIAVFSKKPLLWAIVWGLCIGFFIETMQYVLPIDRYPQLQDAILNAFSVVMGSGYVCLINLFKKWIFIKRAKSKIACRIQSGDTFLPGEVEYCKTVLKLDLQEYIKANNQPRISPSKK